MEDIKGLRDTNIHDQIAFQLEWVDMMRTEAGRKVAKVRGDFMLDFLRHFKLEVDGGDL